MLRTRSENVYKHPFCKGYWLDAVSELKSTKMLVFAALIIALRVALKSVRIPLGVNLDITPAFLANVLGAMVYGPVVGAIGAFISDFLGVLIRGDQYFLPYVLTEISSTVIFAMFFYRQKHSTTRVILSRFIICLGINVLMQSRIDLWYQAYYMGYTSEILLLPRIFKNLFMFPIEVVLMTVFLGAVVPITRRMRLTFAAAEKIAFSKKQIALLLVLVMVGVGSVTAYLFYHYDNTSLSSAYTASERTETNKAMKDYVLSESDDWDDTKIVTVVESAYKEFLKDPVTYTVAIYQVDEAALAENIAAAKAEDPNSDYSEETLWTYSKSPAGKDSSLVKVATATIVLDEELGAVVSYSAEALQ